MTLAQLTLRLANVPGPPGHEGTVARAIRAELPDVPGDWTVDALGNLSLRIPGRDAEIAPLLVAAHMDQVAVVVQSIEASGVARLMGLGAIDPRALAGAPVQVWADAGPIPGVIGHQSRHHATEEQLRAGPALDELWVDVGAESAADARTMGLEIGQPATFDAPARWLGPRLLTGAALDDRAGCAVLVDLARGAVARRPDRTLVLAWTVQEEVGAHGARALAHSITPSAVVVVDTVPARDPVSEGAHSGPVVGGGPALRMLDVHPTGATLYSASLTTRLRRLAADRKVPVQLDLAIGSFTDASELQFAGGGCATAAVLMPRRSSHGPAEVINVRDVEQTAQLLQAFTEQDIGDLQEADNG